jgi:hypothetical protein
MSWPKKKGGDKGFTAWSSMLQSFDILAGGIIVTTGYTGGSGPL